MSRTLIVLASFLLLAACETAPEKSRPSPEPPPSAEAPQIQAPDPKEVLNYPHVTLWQRLLQTELGFADPVAIRADDGLIQVTLTLTGRGPRRVTIEYRVLWLDEQRRTVGPEMNWARVSIEPGQQFNLVSAIKATEVVDFNFHIRKAQKQR